MHFQQLISMDGNVLEALKGSLFFYLSNIRWECKLGTVPHNDNLKQKILVDS